MQGRVRRADLRHLRRLDLSHNPLTVLASNSFTSLHHLQSLRISSCASLEHLERNVFKGLRSLHTLTLTHSAISSLHTHALDGLNNLQSLSLRANKLTSLNHSMLSSRSLVLLDIGENDLSGLPYNWIAGQVNLSTLYLDHNHITDVRTATPDTMPGVSLLDLSYNDLIYLDGNVFWKLTNLRTLSIAGNPLMCDCNLEEFLSWIQWMYDHDALTLVSQQRVLCHAPVHLTGHTILEYSPGQWQCHVSTYGVPLLCILGTVCVMCVLMCMCKRRSTSSSPSSHDTSLDYTEHDLEQHITEDTGSLTHINGHAPCSSSSAGHHSSTDPTQAQNSSSVDSSQSSITALCLPLHNFRRGKKSRAGCDADNDANGHVLLESDDSEPEDTIVEDAVV